MKLVIKNRLKDSGKKDEELNLQETKTAAHNTAVDDVIQISFKLLYLFSSTYFWIVV